jgi:3-dehydroquinate dehydratase
MDMTNIFKLPPIRKPKNKWDVVAQLIERLEAIDEALIQPELLYTMYEKAYGSKVSGDIKEYIQQIRARYENYLRMVLDFEGTLEV